MTIFADRHHDGLAYSLRLMAKRLGFDIYFPIGMEWYNEELWDIAKPYNNSPDTAMQYLSLDQAYKPIDGTVPLNTITNTTPAYYEIKDLAHGDTLKAITLEQFRHMEIEVILASIPDHWHTYKRLRTQEKPKAKVVAQMGNMFDEIHGALANGTVTNIMASTSDFPLPGSVNACFYHQEMPTADFTRSPELNPKIKSFVHLFPASAIFYSYQKMLEDMYDFFAFGAGCPDGTITGLSNVYKEMQDSNFIWQVKPRGDGFGWNWHSAFMLGRPVITNFSDYKDKLGGKLFEDLVTGIDLEKRSMYENVKLLRNMSYEENIQMCEAARKRFFEVVNYEEEAIKLREFFGKLR